MNTASICAVIAAASGLAAAVAAIFGVVNSRQAAAAALLAHGEARAVNVHINSRMTEMMKILEAASFARGEKAQVDRAAAAAAAVAGNPDVV